MKTDGIMQMLLRLEIRVHCFRSRSKLDDWYAVHGPSQPICVHSRFRCS